MRPNKKNPPWQQGLFSEGDHDPMASFANIMDVMLVFALGLMLALISQSKELQAHFKLDKVQSITSGKELHEVPEALKNKINGGEGMESLGQVYRDPDTGKLILISVE